jgi:hypothetical protein
MLSHLCDLVASGWCSLACCAATANTCTCECWSLSNQEATKLAWVIKECYTSVLYTLLSHLCDIVPSGAVCVPRVLRRNSEYLHGECWSLSNQEAAKLCLQHQRDVIHQCYTYVESFVPASAFRYGCVHTRVLRHNSEYHGECWSLSNQEATKLLGHQRMLYISVTCLLVRSHLCD